MQKPRYQSRVRYSSHAAPTPHLSSQHPDPEHVQRLPPDILGTHVDDALHSEPGTGGSGGDTVLPSTRLGDDLGLAESLGEQDLSDGVVDLVRTGVVQVFSPEKSRTDVASAWSTQIAIRPVQPTIDPETHFIQILAPPACSVNLSAKYKLLGLFMYPYIPSNSFQNDGSARALL